MRVHYFGLIDRYVLVNDSGNGPDYVQQRYETIQDLMSQLTNGLSAWEAVEGPA